MDPLDPARTALIAIDTHRGHLDPAIAIQASAVRDGLDRTVGRFSAIREDPWVASSEGGRETRARPTPANIRRFSRFDFVHYDAPPKEKCR